MNDHGRPPEPVADLDIVIPVYNEGPNIVAAVDALADHVRTRFRILICYDSDEDSTLEALAEYDRSDVSIVLVRNPDSGPHSAVRAGFAASAAPAVLVYMADDDYNAGIVDAMVERFRDGCDVVAASRFMPQGSMVGCQNLLKEWIARWGSVALRTIAGIPVHDGTNSFRLFSRRLLERVEIESRVGFTFSVELLAKAVRLNWLVSEIPAQWIERGDRKSRFQVIRWLPAYVRWLMFSLATRWLRRGPDAVPRRRSALSPAPASD